MWLLDHSKQNIALNRRLLPKLSSVLTRFFYYLKLAISASDHRSLGHRIYPSGNQAKSADVLCHTQLFSDLAVHEDLTILLSDAMLVTASTPYCPYYILSPRDIMGVPKAQNELPAI
jgi:hypothetical protein